MGLMESSFIDIIDCRIRCLILACMSDKTYTIQQLEEISEVSRRTIRFYITRELLPPALGAKRGSYYTEEHFRLLREIRRLVEEGYPLLQIKNIIYGSRAEVDPPMVDTFSESASQGKATNKTDLCQPAKSQVLEKEVVERIHLAKGVELYIQPGKLDSETLFRIRELVRMSLSPSKE